MIYCTLNPSCTSITRTHTPYDCALHIIIIIAAVRTRPIRTERVDNNDSPWKWTAPRLSPINTVVVIIMKHVLFIICATSSVVFVVQYYKNPINYTRGLGVRRPCVCVCFLKIHLTVSPVCTATPINHAALNGNCKIYSAGAVRNKYYIPNNNNM